MHLPASVGQYGAYIKATPQCIVDTYRCKEGLANASELLSTAQRIFFTGSGSSIPAALLGAQLFTQNTPKAGIFAHSSFILNKSHLTAKDVVVLVTQGWNRADAVLITQYVRSRRAGLIVITGHPELASRHTLGVANAVIVPIWPSSEKVFCRPASVVTSYIKVSQLVGELSGIHYPETSWIDAYNENIVSSLKLDTTKQYIILASSLLLCAGSNVALSIREGAGCYGSAYEIESYGHGVYVPDQIHKKDTQYILLMTDKETYYKDSVARIMPMLKATESSFDVWTVSCDAVLGNVTFMHHVAKLILDSVQSRAWDMNNPPGMEENRSFHEV